MERSSQRVIHAYAHVRTNQVLYSFTPQLHNASAARQFPDTGANTSFTHLRKDLWRPLWTLSIPKSKHADAQGRHVFKKLREWRKLHETSWEPPAMLSLNHSKKEIQRMQDELDQRGGSKKENVYDVIKHKKKKMRVAAVLDQRANSVADLAAVLVAQEALGAQTQENKDEELKGRQEFQAQTQLDLAKEAKTGALDEMKARRTELAEAIAKAELGEPTEVSKSQLKQELHELRTRAKKMRWSACQVEKAIQEVKETNPNLSPEQQEARVREILPEFPARKAPIPKRGSLRARIERLESPVFSTRGIVVKWANQLDAEYAQAWPETVAHEPMGLTRHRAPNVNDEAILDVASFRSKQTWAYEARNGIEAASEDALTPEAIGRKEGLKKVKGEIVSMVRQAVVSRAAREIRAYAREGRRLLDHRYHKR